MPWMALHIAEDKLVVCHLWLEFLVGILGLLWWFLGSDDPKRRSWGILSLSLSFLMCTYVHGPTYLSGMLLFAAGWADDTT